MKNIKIKDLHIGNANGITEASNKGFENYFYTDNKYYESLVNNKEKFIVAGKKGTGKTLLAKYYESIENKKGNPSVVITMDRNYYLQKLIELGKENIEDSERDLFTEFFFLTEMGDLLLNNKKRFIKIECLPHIVRILKSFRYLNDVIKERNEITNYRIDQYSVESSISSYSTKKVLAHLKRAMLNLQKTLVKVRK